MNNVLRDIEREKGANLLSTFKHSTFNFAAGTCRTFFGTGLPTRVVVVTTGTAICMLRSLTGTALRSIGVRSIMGEPATKRVKKGVITIVTGNANKLKEVQTILGEDFPYDLVINGADLPEYQGEADTVSRLKCKSAYEIIKGPVLVEDTCLCFDALNGLPGPYIKWFLKSIGPEGLHKMLKGFDDHSASAVATLAYYDGESEVELFKGITRGKIVSPRGKGGFGWDVCFQPEGYELTYGEMTASEKNEISHRKRAVEAMRDHFNKISK